MTQRKFELHDGKKGAALAVRITTRAAKNQIVGALSDGTIKVHIAAEPSGGHANVALVNFLSSVLGIPSSKLEVVAGDTGRDKLISVLDMDVETVHKRIVAHME